MKKCMAIGEALIDFIPGESGKGIAGVSSFSPKVGGAPANVCGAFAKLGGDAAMITQLGDDPFGDKIEEELSGYGIDTSYIRRTSRANTSLAFVALKDDGNREFSFYRKPGADMLYSEENLKPQMFRDVFCLHFCSVSLGDFPMGRAHKKAVSLAKEQGAIISFDPNLRFNLWEDQLALKDAVLSYLPLAHIVKISDEELFFITGRKRIEDAVSNLFEGETKLVIYTMGKDGAMAFTQNARAFSPSVKPEKVVDTTGAGDGFMGSFLYQLAAWDVTPRGLSKLSEAQLKEALDFSNAFCSKSIGGEGAIPSYPTMEEMKCLN